MLGLQGSQDVVSRPQVTHSLVGTASRGWCHNRDVRGAVGTQEGRDTGIVVREQRENQEMFPGGGI